MAVKDAVNHTLANNYHSDAEHASIFARKSTSAGASARKGTCGTLALLDHGCKLQTNCARSWESENVAVDQVVKALKDTTRNRRSSRSR